VATLQRIRGVSGRSLPDPCKSRTLFTPKRRPSHGVARSVADCMTRNLSCTACVCPLTLFKSTTSSTGIDSESARASGVTGGVRRREFGRPRGTSFRIGVLPLCAWDAPRVMITDCGDRLPGAIAVGGLRVDSVLSASLHGGRSFLKP